MIRHWNRPSQGRAPGRRDEDAGGDYSGQSQPKQPAVRSA